MSDFALRLVRWQKQHGRHDLPWQNQPPYQVWVSEVMLQQTQVARVRDYYPRFLALFPDVHVLAAAPLSQVLGVWSGLGYYARARNLHKAAIIVSAAGGFPSTISLDALQALPGISRSTAGAVWSLAYQRSAPILDGNVRRVLRRYFCKTLSEKEMWQLANSLLPPDHQAAAYAQALMDLGAEVCTLRTPRCAICPLLSDCAVHRTAGGNFLLQPARRIQRKEIKIHWHLMVWRRRIYLESRPLSGIWGGLLTPPLLADMPAQKTKILPTLQHDLTHRRLQVIPCLQSAPPFPQSDGGRWYRFAELAQAPLPAPLRKILKGLALLNAPPKS